jgi:nuclear pore complex protein Nup160
MDAGEQLVAAHLTSLYPSSQISAIPIPTLRRNTPLPPAPRPDGPPVEHAIFSATVHAPIFGTVVLRVLHQGLILELLSLSVDIQPLRLVLPSPVVPSPAIFLWEGTEIHVLAVTEFGSIFRLVLSIGEGNVWQEPIRPNWCREYLIKSAPVLIDGLVHIQGTHCVLIGQRNGSLLRIETESLGDDRRDGVFDVQFFVLLIFMPALRYMDRNFAPTFKFVPYHHFIPSRFAYWTTQRSRNRFNRNTSSTN